MPLTAKEIFCLAVWYASFRSKLIAMEIGFNAITEASPKKNCLFCGSHINVRDIREVCVIFDTPVDNLVTPMLLNTAENAHWKKKI